MNKAELAALTALLDSVGLGYTKHQAETKLLRAYLQRTQQTVTYKAKSEPVVITLGLAACAQAPAPAREPKAGRNPVFDPEQLDAHNTYLPPASIPAGLLAARIHWTNKMGLVMTAEDIIKRPTDRVRPWAYTWVALAAKVKTDAPAKKAKAK